MKGSLHVWFAALGGVIISQGRRLQPSPYFQVLPAGPGPARGGAVGAPSPYSRASALQPSPYSRASALQPFQPTTFKYGLVLEDSGDTISVILPEGGFVSFDAEFDAQLSHGPGMTHPKLLADGGLPVTLTDLARHRLAMFGNIMSSTIDQVLHPRRKKDRKDTRFLRLTFLPVLQEKLKKELGEDILVESLIETIQGLEFLVSSIALDSDVRGIQETILFTIDDSLTEFGFRERTGLLRYSEGTTGFDLRSDLPVFKARAASIIPESGAQGAQSSGSMDAGLAHERAGEMVDEVFHPIF